MIKVTKNALYKRKNRLMRGNNGNKQRQEGH